MKNKMRIRGRIKTKVGARHKLTNFRAQLKSKLYKFVKKNPSGRGLY